MSKCRYCGKAIVWARNRAGRWLPPLESPLRELNPRAQLMLVSIDTPSRVPVQSDVSGLRLASFHECPGPPVESQLEPDEDEEPPPVNVPQHTSMQLYKQRQNEIALEHWKTARRREVMKFECPECAAPAGQPCRYVGSHPDGFLVQAPHAQRVHLAPMFSGDAVFMVASEAWSEAPLRDYAEHPCPLCGADPGQPCRRRFRPELYMVKAHQARIELEKASLQSLEDHAARDTLVARRLRYFFEGPGEHLFDELLSETS